MGLRIKLLISMFVHVADSAYFNSTVPALRGVLIPTNTSTYSIATNIVAELIEQPTHSCIHSSQFTKYLPTCCHTRHLGYFYSFLAWAVGLSPMNSLSHFLQICHWVLKDATHFNDFFHTFSLLQSGWGAAKFGLLPRYLESKSHILKKNLVGKSAVLSSAWGVWWKSQTKWVVWESFKMNVFIISRGYSLFYGWSRDHPLNIVSWFFSTFFRVHVYRTDMMLIAEFWTSQHAAYNSK